MLATHHHPSRVRLGLRAQLIIAMGVLAALIAAVAAIALLSLQNVRDNTSRTLGIEAELDRLARDVVSYTQLCRLNEKDYFLNIGNPMLRDSSMLEWQNNAASLDLAITAFGRTAVTTEDRQQASQWHLELDHYRTAFQGVHQSIDVGYIFTTEAAIRSLSLYKQDIQSLTKSAQTVAEIKARLAQRAEATLQETIASSSQVVLGISVLALLMAVLWCLLFPIHLMRPIAALQSATSRLAGGELGARVQLKRADELGVLGRRFDEMAETIQQRTCAIEAQHEHANAARIEAETARAAIAEQLATIDAQRNVIREMSVPVLPLSQSALVLPLIGALDSERLALVQEQALHAIEQLSGRFLILDITGVPIVDTAVAQGLIQIVHAARLLGSEVVLVGIRPEVAQAVVGLGIHLNDFVTRSTLQSGITYVLGRGERTRAVRASAN